LSFLISLGTLQRDHEAVVAESGVLNLRSYQLRTSESTRKSKQQRPISHFPQSVRQSVHYSADVLGQDRVLACRRSSLHPADAGHYHPHLRRLGRRGVPGDLKRLADRCQPTHGAETDMHFLCDGP
jgi:hypothetical protein